jgi:hypothetical protein
MINVRRFKFGLNLKLKEFKIKFKSGIDLEKFF